MIDITYLTVMCRILLFLFTCCIMSGLFAQKTNRLNKHKQRTGKWIVYMNEEKKIKSFEGRFRNGRNVGKSYYYADGILERVERNRRRKLVTTFYYPSGTVRMKGQARIVNDTNKIEYFFYGRWKQYDEQGRCIKYCYYDKGRIIKTKYLAKGTVVNDSLIFALNNLEKGFFEKNKNLVDSIHAQAFDPPACERLKRRLLAENAPEFGQVEGVLNRFGYPPRAVALESNDIPFYLMNFAPCALRERYLPVFETAVSRGELGKTTLAIYIDKIKVAKGEPQVYGTQYFFNKEREAVFYPSIDPSHLGQRRKAAGFAD